MSADLQQIVASSADGANMHATVPTLLLELQTVLGSLTASATTTTERGRRPFRPGPDWPQRLGELAYAVYLLGDQSGVDVDQAVRGVAGRMQRTVAQQPPSEQDWPFPNH